jgi:hypothetical protein
VDERSRKKLYKRFAKRHFDRAVGWEKGEVLISFHETHPHAERKPRQEFLAALERTIPEVRTSLDHLKSLHARAYTGLHSQPGVINELEDWGELKHAAFNYPQDDETRRALADLYAGVKTWAEAWYVGEPYWQQSPSWMLDQAVSYISIDANSFIYGSEGVKKYLSTAERRFVIQEDVKLHYLKPELEKEREKYIREKKDKWEAGFREHLASMGEALNKKHGEPIKKRQRRHFDWLALRHVLGYSSETICKAYVEIVNKALDMNDTLSIDIDLGKGFVPNRRSVDEALAETARLLGLNVRELRKGKRKSGAVGEECDDVIRRLGLERYLETQPAY